MPNYWLLKTEPSAYSFQQLVKDKQTVWDGVKNNLALKNISAIQKGDQLLIYHTGAEKAAMGMAKALSGAYPDPEKKDSKLLVFDIVPAKALRRPVSLAEVKADARLARFDLVRLPRLSVMPVTEGQWKIILEMAER